MPDTLDRSRTPLLTLITQDSLDRDYQLVAARGSGPTSADREEGSRLRGYRLGVVLVVGLFAMLVTVAAVQTSQNADVDDASRASLIERVEGRRATVRSLQEELAALRIENSVAQDALRAVGRRYASAQTERTRLGAVTGFEKVTGPGVRITLDNAAYAGADARLRDSDLALLADGLWAAGAEAIAINGQRLTGVGGIRNVGDAIEVNGIGIAPPYTVLALGDRQTLPAELVETPSGLRFFALAQQYGFETEVDPAADIDLPSAPGVLRRLRFAEQADSSPRTGGGDVP